MRADEQNKLKAWPAFGFRKPLSGIPIAVACHNVKLCSPQLNGEARHSVLLHTLPTTVPVDLFFRIKPFFWSKLLLVHIDQHGN